MVIISDLTWKPCGTLDKISGGVLICVNEESKDRPPEYFNTCNSAWGGDKI